MTDDRARPHAPRSEAGATLLPDAAKRKKWRAAKPASVDDRGRRRH
jgi:hypothetical protein